MGLTRYLTTVALLAALCGAGWGWWQGLRADRLAADLDTATEALAGARAALAAQSAHVARVEAEAARADQIRRDILEAPNADCPIPDWLRDLPGRLRATDRPVADPR
ncbi:hypothetical protein ACEYYA_01000 [Paracoccus sp. p3-h83]|uniref:hypothetical protein n=1 Tax=Paracoccus sp. p3-h83 TaxID=3342805 RepID=UPI0035B80CEC